MKNLLASLIYGIDPQFLPDRLTQVFLLDMRVKKYYKRLLPFTFFESQNLPQPEYKKVIHLLRNGRDVMASYFAMNKDFDKIFHSKKMIIEEKQWKRYDHSSKWIKYPYDVEIIQVKYEQTPKIPKKS